jgi:hypothetical protein
MMSLEALKLQAPASDAEQVLRSMTFAQQREQSEAKRRVLFVLQVVPDDSSPATIAKQGPSAKADAAKPAAAPAPSAPAAQSQPGGARANPPGPIPAGKAVQ